MTLGIPRLESNHRNDNDSNAEDWIGSGLDATPVLFEVLLPVEFIIVIVYLIALLFTVKHLAAKLVHTRSISSVEGIGS